jgi:hypothetical protein
MYNVKMTLLYIGAGFDISPLLLDNLNTFIFTDVNYCDSMDGEYVTIKLSPNSPIIKIPTKPIGYIYQKYIRYKLNELQKADDGYKINKETSTTNTWTLQFENGKKMIYVFSPYPFEYNKLPDNINTILEKNIQYLYIDGYIPYYPNISLKGFDNIHTVYWSETTDYLETESYNFWIKNKKLILTSIRCDKRIPSHKEIYKNVK